jgi:hypothetical protein
MDPVSRLLTHIAIDVKVHPLEWNMFVPTVKFGEPQKVLAKLVHLCCEYQWSMFMPQAMEK